jgi:hypothetical protein
VGLGIWAWSASDELWTAVRGAVRTEGVVERIEGVREKTRKRRRREEILAGYIIFVRFTGPDGVERVLPAQYGGTTPEDTVFDEYTTDITDFRPEGEKEVSLLYHPELGNLVWINDFYTLWAYPLFLWLATLVSALVAGLIIWRAFSGRAEPKRDD